MTKMEYAQAIANEVGGEVKEVTKNGVQMLGVTKWTENGIAPMMYVDEAYEDELEVSTMAKMFNDALANTQKNVDISDMTNWETAKEMVTIKLVNKSRISTEVCRSAKAYGFDDLMIVPIIFTNAVGNGVVTVTESIIKSWGVTKRTVIDRAIKNTQCVVRPLAEVLAEITGGPEFLYESPFTIVSTGNNTLGAAGIIKAKDKLEGMFPDGYYVIPSSVHEVLVLPKDINDDNGKINTLINEVNTDVLDPVDYLSDHVYEFVA